MDALYFKVDKLRSLWAEYRSVNETGSGSDKNDYGDQSEWARGKLQVILTELDKLIQEQILWKSTLSAEIEDLLIEIEEYCQLFGRNVDTIIPQAALLHVEVNNSTRDKLTILRNELKEEVYSTRINIKKWLTSLRTFVKELESDYVVPSDEIFENDLSRAIVLPVWCRYDEYRRVVFDFRNEFEESSIQLHYYWDILNYKPKDEIDKALLQIFTDKPNPKDIFEKLQETLKNKNNNDDDNNNSSSSNNNNNENVNSSDIDKIGENQNINIDLESLSHYIYYTTQLPSGLKLTPEHLETLKRKILGLEKDFTERKQKLMMLKKTIHGLYEELEVPKEKRLEFSDSLDEEYLNKLTKEYESLREIMRERIQKAIDEHTVRLGELWDKCLVPQYERDEFFENLRSLNSAEEVYELLSQEIDRLEDLYAKCAKIYRWMLERRALIEKMIEFEKSASDPRRLFQSSFRLLEEEKWRKTCWPNLVKIEDQLINACVAYEEAERKPFMHESKRYLDTLQSEISERIVNQMFFGFEQNSSRNPKSSNNNNDENNTNTNNNNNNNKPKSTPKRKDTQKTMSSRPPSPTNNSSDNRRNSRLFPKTSPSSRSVSPSNGNNSNGRYPSSRRNSQYIPSRSVSPTGSRSRRNSQAISQAVSQAIMGVNGGSRAPSRTPSRAPSRTPSRAPSRAVSPMRSSSNSNISRNVSPVRSNSNNNNGNSEISSPSSTRRRTSLHVVNTIEPSSNHKSSPSKSPKSTRSSSSSNNKNNNNNNSNSENATTTTDQNNSFFLENDGNNDDLSNKNNETRRSNSISSSSSESSSSIATPTMLEPSSTSYVVNGLLSVPSSSSPSPSSPSATKTKLKIEINNNSSTKSIKSNIPPPSKMTLPSPKKTPTSTSPTTTSSSLPKPVVRRVSSTPLRPRPQSMVNSSSLSNNNDPSSILKRQQINKRVSMIVEGGR